MIGGASGEFRNTSSAAASSALECLLLFVLVFAGVLIGAVGLILIGAGFSATPQSLPATPVGTILAVRWPSKGYARPVLPDHPQRGVASGAQRQLPPESAASAHSTKNSFLGARRLCDRTDPATYMACHGDSDPGRGRPASDRNINSPGLSDRNNSETSKVNGQPLAGQQLFLPTTRPCSCNFSARTFKFGLGSG
jgi:hypothetical protein